MKIHHFFIPLFLVSIISFFFYINDYSFGSLFFSVIFGSIFFYGYQSKPSPSGIDIFRPYLLTSILLYLYSLSGILFVETTSLNLYGEFVTERSSIIFVFASLLTQLGITLGFVSHTKSFAYSTIAKESKKNDEINYLVFFAIFFSIIFFSFIYKSFLPSEAISYTEWSLQSRVDKLSSNSSGLKEIIFQNTPTVLLICALIHILFANKYNFFLRLFSLILISLYLYTQFLSGARANLMIAMLLLSVYINYRVYKFNLMQVILGGASVYILINLISILRLTSNPIEMIYILSDQLSSSGLAFLSLQRSGELLTSLNAITIIEGVESGATTFQSGSLFLNQVLAFIPKFIWPARPEFASVLFVKHFYPGIYDMGGGFGFSVVAEGFWEFGLIGCVFYGFLTGFFSERIYQIFLATKHNEIYLFLYALIFSRIVILIHRSGLFSSIKAALIVSIPILFILLIYQLHKFYKKINEDTVGS